MDSFYEAPRRAPVPRASKIISAPVVPEVSIIAGVNPMHRKCDSPGVLTAADHLEKKQVRFENYYGQINAEEVLYCSNLNLNSEKTKSKPFRKNFDEAETIAESKQAVPPQYNYRKNQISKNEIKENNPLCNLSGKTFEQIYMANVPNRKLDLSILDHPMPPREFKQAQTKTVPPSKINSNTLNDIQESSTHQEVITHQKSPSYRSFRSKNPPAFVNTISKHQNPYKFEKTENRETHNSQLMKKSDRIEDRMDVEKLATEDKVVTKRDDGDEPTIKDLFKIIHQQNEQIMLLQKQVAELTSCVTRYPQLQEPPILPESYPKNPIGPGNGKGPLSKFSIDVKATSFELSFRPQKFNRKEFCEPKIQELKELDDSRTVDCSKDIPLNLPLESIDIREPCPSPEPSIQIDMDDYESSGEDDACENIGMTFYRGLMDQVNNALKNAQPKFGEKPNNQTMQEVKDATLRHLKSIGVNVPQAQLQNDSNGSSDLSPSDVSFEVKQLLMKYLPDEYLTKLSNKREAPTKNLQKPAGSDFSMATLQYMKKYNLISDKQPPRRNYISDGSNVLNISTLKFQPKFL